MDFPHFIQECHRTQADRVDEQPLTMSLAQLPSRLHVEDKIQQLSINKAPGIDGIASEWLRDAGPDIAEPILQLFLKMWLTGSEPVQFKGGLLHCIAKKTGSRDVANMRGIMIIDILGKLAHSLLRQRFLSAVLRWRRPLQIGGFPRCTTLFATQFLKSFNAKARECKLSSAVLFLDVKSAFHCLIRQVLFGLRDGLPEHLHTILQEQGCDVDQLLNAIDQTSNRFHQDVPLADRRLLHDAHEFTWFGLAGTNEAFCTARGSRPGSPHADIAFNALMTHVLEALDECLAGVGPLQAGFLSLGLKAPPVAWVDDVAIPIVVSHGTALESTIDQIVQVTHHAFLRFGLELNYKAKKTEVLVSFRALDAPKLRHSLFVERLGHLDIPSLQLHLKCLASYEHLGTMFAADCTLQRDIAHRKMKATQAFRLVGKSILKNRHIDAATRLKLFESLIIPVLMHGAGNWDLLPTRSFQGLHARIMSWQRIIINDGCWTDNQHTDFELQCRWKLPPLALRLAKARLLHAFHCFTEGPQILVDFVTSIAHLPQGWFAGLRQALRWLADMDADFCPVELATASPERILSWFVSTKSSGPSTVKRLFQRCIMQFHVVGDVAALHKQLRETLQHGGITFVNTDIATSHPHDQLFSCQWCAMQFDSSQKLQAHLWTAHQIISEERRFVFSDTCLACHKCFWTAARLQQHLRLSRQTPGGCYEQLTWRYAPLNDQCVVNVPADLRGFQRLPAQVVPMPQTSVHEYQIATRVDAEQMLQRAWDDEGFPPCLPEHVRNEIIVQADTIMKAWQPFPRPDYDGLIFHLTSLAWDSDREWALFLWCREHLRFQRFDHLPQMIFQRAKTEIQTIVFDSPIGRLLAWHFRISTAFHPKVTPADEHIEAAVRDLEPLLNPVRYQRSCLQHVLHPIATSSSCPLVPVHVVDGQPTIWVLHLFSGRRRRGDCHFWSECCTGVLPGYVIRILSVDTAIHGVHGNLDRGPVFMRLLRIIRKGFFAAGLTGPPCETFSAARHLKLEGRQPRPLRSAELPWLLENRGLRELFQTMIGSRLLLHSYIAEAELVLAGAGTIMEHPTEPPDEQKVSTWRLPCHEEWMMHLPDAFRHRIEQWRFGAVGVKPTTLRAIHLGPPALVAGVLHDQSDPLAIRPHTSLCGRDQDGSFRTAAAKEYPPRLCRALIIATLTGIRHRLSQHGSVNAQSLTHDEQTWVTNLHAAATEANLSGKYLPDFQG